MRGELKIEKCKLKIENLCQRVALSSLALCALCLFAGCPQAQVVTVTMKAAGGAAETASTEETPTEAEGYGTLTGTITFEGAPKELPPLVAQGDPSLKPEDTKVCAAAPVPDESLVVNSSNKGIANVIIFLEKRPGNIKPDLAKPPTDPVYFDQKGCRFLPHVLVVQTGQPLLVISDDPIPHNTHTYPSRNSSFNKVISANERTGVPCDYKKPEAGPISVKCDLHTWMKGYHFPVDHPYVAVTDKDGKFKIEGLPAGKHSFNVWHERGPGGSQLLKRKMQIAIEVDKEATSDMTFGPTSFAAAPKSSSRAIAYERLLDGGELVVTRTEAPR